MKSSEIKEGQTYLFVATDAPARKSLEGKPFTVAEIKSVWRRQYKQSKLVRRFFNEDGVGARADELEPMDKEFIELDDKVVERFAKMEDKSVATIPSESLNADKPKNPCFECGIGEMFLVAYNGGEVHLFKCNNCGHTENYG